MAVDKSKLDESAVGMVTLVEDTDTAAPESVVSPIVPNESALEAPVRVDLGEVALMTTALVDQDLLFMRLKELIGTKDALAQAIAVKLKPTFTAWRKAVILVAGGMSGEEDLKAVETTFAGLQEAVQTEMNILLQAMMNALPMPEKLQGVDIAHGRTFAAVGEWAGRVKKAYSDKPQVGVNLVNHDFQSLNDVRDNICDEISVAFHEMVDAIANSLIGLIPADQEASSFISPLEIIFDDQRNNILTERPEGSTADFVVIAKDGVGAGHTALQGSLDEKYAKAKIEFEAEKARRERETKAKERADELDEHAGAFMGKLVEFLKAEACRGNDPDKKNDANLRSQELHTQVIGFRRIFGEWAQAMFEGQELNEKLPELAFPSMENALVAFRKHFGLMSFGVANRTETGRNVILTFNALAEQMVRVVAEYVKGGVKTNGSTHTEVKSAVDAKIAALTKLMTAKAKESAQALVKEYGLDTDPIADLAASAEDQAGAFQRVLGAVVASRAAIDGVAGKVDALPDTARMEELFGQAAAQHRDASQLIAGRFTHLDTRAAHAAGALGRVQDVLNGLSAQQQNIAPAILTALNEAERRLTDQLVYNVIALKNAKDAGYEAGHRHGRFVGAFLGVAASTVFVGLAGSAYMLSLDAPERTSVSASTAEDRRGEEVQAASIPSPSEVSKLALVHCVAGYPVGLQSMSQNSKNPLQFTVQEWSKPEVTFAKNYPSTGQTFVQNQADSLVVNVDLDKVCASTRRGYQPVPVEN
jgi:hypothetical protein